MEATKINLNPLYLSLKGTAINSIPVLIAFINYLCLGGEGPGLGLLFYLLSFIFLIVFYRIYILLRKKEILEDKIKRRIVLFSPCWLSIPLNFLFAVCFSDNILVDFCGFLLLYSPFLLITFIYALYLEITLRKRLNAEKESVLQITP